MNSRLRCAANLQYAIKEILVRQNVLVCPIPILQLVGQLQDLPAHCVSVPLKVGGRSRLDFGA